MNSNSSNTLIAKNTIILNIRLVVVLAINLVISRLVLKNLGVEDYGLYALVGGFVSLLAIITASITGTAQRFITYELGKGDNLLLSKTFSNILNALGIIAAGVLLLGVVLGLIFIKDYLNIPVEKGNTALFVYFCSLATFVINLIMVPYMALINAHEHMRWYAIVSVIDAVLKLSVVALLALFYKGRLEIYAFLLVIVCLAIFFLYLGYCRKHFQESRYQRCYDGGIVKRMFSFSVWMGIGSAAGTIKDQGGNILINLFFGLTLNASMGIANQIRGLLAQFANNIGVAIAPQITKSFAEGQVDRSIRLTFFRTKCQGIFILFISIPILIYTDELLSLWLGEVPEYSALFVRQMCIVSILNSLAQGYGPLFLAKGDIKNYQIFGSVLLLTYIPFTYIVLKLTDDPRFCLLFNIVYELFFVFSNFYVLRIKVQFPYLSFMKEVILRIGVCFLVAILLARLIRSIMVNNNLLVLLLNIFIISVLYIVSAYFIVLDRREKELVRDYIKKAVNRLIE